MELTGKIIVIDETQTVGAKSFRKRDFVVETSEDKYPQKIKIEAVQDKVDLLDNFSVGQKVKVEFNLRGSEYNGKYYTSVQAWKITAESGGASRPAAPAARSGAPARTGGAAKPTTRPASPPNQSVDEDVPW